ncbi:MAG: enoyl-CoA hydratase/isomerase family protein [Treponema sp.]|jgi:enoyl-CoA hydratase|nr:enoyl-CoA hydratase/isomerase family protein [Treponema sp.]
MGNILYEQRELTGILTLNRPEALNALNNAIMRELSEALDKIASSDIRCLIITGAGKKAFIAGADVAEMQNYSPEDAAASSRKDSAVLEKLENLPMPVIAAVNGYALGGGCELALACDLRIAAENARFGLPEASLGIFPGLGGVQRLMRLIGITKAKELLFAARQFDAQEALKLGLVNAVVPAEKLMEASLETAGAISKNAPLAVRVIKMMANRSIGLSLKEAVGLEQEYFAICFSSADQKEAMAAFMEKRKPAPFCGR